MNEPMRNDVMDDSIGTNGSMIDGTTCYESEIDSIMDPSAS